MYYAYLCYNEYKTLLSITNCPFTMLSSDLDDPSAATTATPAPSLAAVVVVSKMTVEGSLAVMLLLLPELTMTMMTPMPISPSRS
jgi:hypothetical protein